MATITLQVNRTEKKTIELNTLRTWISLVQSKNSNVFELAQATKNLMRMLQIKARANYIAGRLYERYGAKELTYCNITEQQLFDAALMGFSKAILKYSIRDRIDNPDVDVDAIIPGLKAYINTYMDAEVKRFVEHANGITQYKATLLMRIKKSGLDLWNSPDEELCAALKNYVSTRTMKHPERTLQRLRNIFKSPEEAAMRGWI